MPDRTTVALVEAMTSLARAVNLASGSISSPQGKEDYNRHLTEFSRQINIAMRPDDAPTEADRS